MEQEDDVKTKPKSGPRANVRFSDQEYGQLLRDEQIRGLSIPILLKEAYFNGRPTAVLMTQDEHKAVLLELLRQGNNLNQITRQANAGIIGNVKDELLRIARSLDGMTALLRAKVLKFKNA